MPTSPTPRPARTFLSFNEFEALIGVSPTWLVFVVAPECDKAARALVKHAQAALGAEATVYGMCAELEVAPLVTFYPPADARPALSREGPGALDDLGTALEAAKTAAAARPSPEAEAAAHAQAVEASARMAAAEDLSRFPSPFRMARSLALEAWRTARRAAEGGEILATAAVAHDRHVLCVACDQYDDGRCRSCGCVMKVKVHVATASCPLGKWQAS